MRAMLGLMVVAGGVMLAGCGRAGCKACPDDASRQTCEDSVQVCNALGPLFIAFRGACIDEAHEICEVDDSGQPTTDTQTGTDDTDRDTDDTDRDTDDTDADTDVTSLVP